MGVGSEIYIFESILNMTLLIVAIFVIGYACIALEHKIRIDKSATALFMFGVIWSLYALSVGDVAAVGGSLIEHLGSTCETLIFLIGAMTIVEIIDTHGGFGVITQHITSRNKFKLVWMLAILTFFMSAVLDNMTTTIIMIMMLRRIIPDQHERYFFAAVIIIAANSGGAWSPIGDVTTIMLWMRGNVTAGGLIIYLLIPSLVSLLIPTYFISQKFRHSSRLDISSLRERVLPQGVGERMSRGVLVAGVLSLLFVPVFKSLTGLPPYVGIMFSLGAMWILIEILYDRKRGLEEESQQRVSKVLQRIDMSTILFFLGILMSVAGLQSAGLLGEAADFLDRNVHEVFSIATVVGMLSSVVDNVPLVAACMGMYPIADAASVMASATPEYAQFFVQDGLFWLLLTYCAGVGGSLLIIGSAAGVVAMGLEKIDFAWYLKNISKYMLIGYLVGVLAIYVESLILF